MGSVASRSCLSQLMKIVKIMKGCKTWLINSNPRSNLTRSKLKRLRKLLHSTWLNSARFRVTFPRLKSELTSMNRPLEKLRLVVAPHPLDPDKSLSLYKKKQILGLFQNECYQVRFILILT